ncbi:putative ATPase, AAA-type, core, AAA-type ATPase domain-containing protein [Rosa chinensis]|uniref:Putative ATPase, AAA-type, core, AAA-type ATPase domain-containing protein n=1 Tax=Rosa chinensis TaxID=74649 RepID=A0A2P6PYU4_ROSCH|nr:AAA-ATPase At3g50940 [Rosa chinensis]PRQ27084.1 putative ATPase, AAA-type, core, AAA-type ATPase domain-containing protein [Rosa chinensis]
MWCSKEDLPSPKTILSVAASVAASAVLIKSVANDLVPDAVHSFFSNRIKKLSSQLTVVVDEFDGLTPNQMFEAANVYLGTKLSSSTQRIKVNKPEKEKQLQVNIDRNQELVDCFNGVKLKWVLVTEKPPASANNNRDQVSEVRHFEIIFHKKHRDMVLSSYLPYVLKKHREIKEERKVVKLHTVDYNGTDYWGSINLDHPANFDTIAMEPEMKKTLIEDLDRFRERKEYYKRVGKAWKRGYLLYGPPGTGKSSLVAAMANYLKFDIFDLDLKEVQCNSDLRRLLIGTKSRSILVIEDIDCSVELQNRDSDQNEPKTVEDDKVSLSGLLNFIDGLWSSCGEERIIVFTTNHKDRLDQALLRPGRMDLHLHMSYCTFSGFKTLAYNYLQIKEHPLFADIEALLLNHKLVTPAEVAGELMKSDDARVSLQGLVEFLQSKNI